MGFHDTMLSVVIGSLSNPMKKPISKKPFISKEKLQSQLKRKSSALELANRELKIEKEHHAREAQIEAALERVRNRSIVMQKSVELGEVVWLTDSEIAGH